MRLPIKQPKAASILTLPDLAGGLNLRDGANEILDNQLTECENMWWRDGSLKTRPGIKIYDENMLSVIGSVDMTALVRNYLNIKTVIEGKTYYLQAIHTSNNLQGNPDTLKFLWRGENKYIQLGEVTVNTKPVNYFVVIKNKTLYCFTNDKKVYKHNVSENNQEWEEAPNTDFHVPLIATYCNSNGSSAMKPEAVLSSGVQIEGYNILSDYYKLQYNAYNPEADKKGSGHAMKYGLLKSCYDEKCIGKCVTAKYTDKNGTVHTHKVEITSEKINEESKALEDGLRMRVLANIIFFLEGDTTSVAIITDEKAGKNNLEIEAPYIPDDKAKEKVFNMKCCEWFGGASAGLAGGTRLFLCGNETEPSLVVWSGLNDPLYFSENSHFYVGDDNSKVIGFGKQSDMLIIFKENETWCTRYEQNMNITKQDLINQSVLDYTASAVYFPLVQINSSIGCGYPETIQLCRNRLVWLGNDKKLYTLISENQYNERNIFCVSEMIEQKIKNSIANTQISSCDWNGYYCLCLGNEMYLMDYNCYGYTHISSYSKTEDANIRIPWYYWKLPKEYIIGALNEKMFLTYFDNLYYDHKYIITAILTENNTSTDNVYVRIDGSTGEVSIKFSELSIKSIMQTKIFDFGVPHVKKNIEQINLQFAKGGKKITLTTISNLGTNENDAILLNDNTENVTGLLESCKVLLCVKQIHRLGLKLECNGPFAIDSIVLKYRILGGVG